MDPDITASLAQFGAAGLMGWMWLTERRSATARERELSAAHDKLIQERRALDLLVTTMQESTRVLTTIEVGQRHLAAVLDRIAGCLPMAHQQAGPDSDRAAA